MRIAFYAPLKSPEHKVPSGDRKIARLFMAALRQAGHDVELVSQLRSWLPQPDWEAREALLARAQHECDALTARWNAAPDTAPELWFTYHPYYKSPDWIGPKLARRLAIPYVTAEASYARKRDKDGWACWQSDIVDALQLAALNLCMTPVDCREVTRLLGTDTVCRFDPFIDIAAPHGQGSAIFPAGFMRQKPLLVAVAMMRPGDKLKSYEMLAEALCGMQALPWSLAIVGSGTARAQVEAAFAGLPPDRIAFCGEASAEGVAAYLAAGDIYVWPGFGEAYGLAFLEAQLAGLPVIAQNTGGIASVVSNDETGLLTPQGDLEAFRAALTELIDNRQRRHDMGLAAARFVREERALEPAARRLDTLLRGLVNGQTGKKAVLGEQERSR